MNDTNTDKNLNMSSTKAIIISFCSIEDGEITYIFTTMKKSY